ALVGDSTDNASKVVLCRFQSRKVNVVVPLRVAGVGASHTLTMRSGSGNGSGFNRTASTILNIAVLAPIPRASNPMVTAANAGSRASEAIPYRTSLNRFSTHRTLR